MTSWVNPSTHVGAGNLLTLGGIEIAVEIMVVDVVDN